MKKTRLFTVLFISVFILSLNSFSQLTVDYDIDTNTTWTTNDSPVTVTKAGFTINDSVTLTIDPDVVVNLVPSSGDITINGFLVIGSGVVIKVNVTEKITIYGKVTANGTSGSKITFDEYSAGNKWDGIYFRKNDSVYKSNFVNTEFKNLERDIAVTQQHVTFESCIFTIPDYNDDLFIRTYGGIVKEDSAFLHVKNCTFNVTSEYECTFWGCERSLIHMDGLDGLIENNTVNYTATGKLINSVSFVSGETSNTDAFTVDVINNTVNMTTKTENTFSNTYGVYFSEYDVTGDVKDNKITIKTNMNAYGTYNTRADLVENNDIKIYLTGSGYSKLYGIYHKSTERNYDEKIRKNKIYISLDSSNYTNQGLTGIYMQGGKAVNNVIEINYTNSDKKSTLKGIEKNVYTGCIENNTIKITHPNDSDNVKGIYLGSHPNIIDTVKVKNNIVVGSNKQLSVGLYRESNFEATLKNGYNLFYNFPTIYSNVTEGEGMLNADPLFKCACLKLDTASPAIDAGDPTSDYSNEPLPNGGRINMGAYGNTSDAASKTITRLQNLFVQESSDALIFPNPFNTYTTITIKLNKTSDVRIDIYSLDGKHVKSLAQKIMSAGTYDVVWQGDNNAGNKLSLGTYICNIRVDGSQFIKKILLAR